jgi:2'-5' RNA ligase
MADNAAVPPTRSALIVAVPEADPIVAGHRDRLDRAASWGVPAHITVLYPFLPPADIDEHVLRVLGRLTAAVPAFFLTLDRIAWFERRVVWLAPDPAEPLRALTAAITARFPQAQPYEGAFADIVPHLTLGHDRSPAELQAAAAQVQPHLPIRSRVTALRLIVGDPRPGDSWTTRTEFPLG